MLPGDPSIWTRITALVFLVIFFFNLLWSKLRVLSILRQIGVAPLSTIASTVATKVKDWVITSSPLPIFSEANATLKAAVPLVTAKAYLAPKYLAKLFSNLFTK